MGVPGKTFEGPLDPVEDFQNPTTVPGSEAEAMVGEPEVQEEQLELLDNPDTPDTPKVVRNGKFLAEFVKPHFERDDSGERFVGFEFSFPLEDEHRDHLPLVVVQEWQHMREGNVSYVKVENVWPQDVSISLFPDGESGGSSRDLTLMSAEISRAILAKVEEKGSGKKNKVIRFSFRAIVDQTDEIAQFAVDHHGDPVWISITNQQGSLFDGSKSETSTSTGVRASNA